MRPASAPQLAPWRRPRWCYAAAAFLLGVVYTVVAISLGFALRLGELDMTLEGGALIELSFAGFGYLLGLTTEARRREQAAARQAEERLRELARTRARLAQAEKLASLGELASAVSHELRNPLAILRAMTQNLEEATLDGDARSTCREMLEEIDRLSGVTSRLMDFARPVTLQPHRVALAELVERTRLLADELLRQRAIHFEVRGGPLDAELDADPDLLCQVLLGLLDNAAAHSPSSAAVELSWRLVDDDAVDLEMADRGPGVPAELRQRIFEPFFTQRADGHGLGLAVARQIVEAHGGRIEALERSGGGAIFRVRLPRARRLESAA